MKTVAIVGSAKTTRDQAPFEDLSVDIWGINEALLFPWMKRATAMFQMHPKWSFSRPDNSNHPEYWDWLRQPHPFPIYMQHRYHDVPASRRYPLTDVVSTLKTARRYFTHTIAYMIALAIYLKYERIEIYGVEQQAWTEYYDMRDCTTYWIGQADARGIEVWLPERCTLFSAKLYGYEGEPMIRKSFFEQRLATWQNKLAETTEKWQQAVGELNAVAALVTDSADEALMGRYEKAVQNERQTFANKVFVEGAMQECQAYMDELVAVLRAAGEQQVEKEYRQL